VPDRPPIGDRQRHQLQLFFDAAHAFGCSYQGRLVGGFGRAEVFSFHATKFCNAFEGGAITTDDDELAHELRLMHNFGFAGYDKVVSLGINGKLSEASAAMGLTSLESLDAFIAVNRRNYDHYARELADIPGLQLMEYDLSERRNFSTWSSRSTLPRLGSAATTWLPCAGPRTSWLDATSTPAAIEWSHTDPIRRCAWDRCLSPSMLPNTC